MTHPIARALAPTLTLLLSLAAARAELTLTADIYDTPGLDGFQTWDITASVVDDGLFGFSIGDGGLSTNGLTGPFWQSPSTGAGVFSDTPDDTGILAPGGVFASIGLEKSAGLLQGSYGLEGGSRPTQPMLRVVTDDAAAVRVNGLAYTDSGAAARGAFPEFDFLLEELLSGPLVVTPPAAVEPPPPVTPPPSPPLPPSPPSPGVVEPLPPSVVEPLPPIAVDPPPAIVEPPQVTTPAPPTAVEPPPGLVEPPPVAIAPWPPASPPASLPGAIEMIPPTITTGVWNPPPPPTREELIASLEQRLEYLPGNIADAEERVAQVASLREAAAEEGFEPSDELLPGGLIMPLFTIDATWADHVTDVWRPYAPPELTVDEFLERLDVIETSALATIAWNEDEIALAEARLEEVLADPDFTPEAWSFTPTGVIFTTLDSSIVQYSDVTLAPNDILAPTTQGGGVAPLSLAAGSLQTPEPGAATLAALATLAGVLARRRRSR